MQSNAIKAKKDFTFGSASKQEQSNKSLLSRTLSMDLTHEAGEMQRVRILEAAGGKQQQVLNNNVRPYLNSIDHMSKQV